MYNFIYIYIHMYIYIYIYIYIKKKVGFSFSYVGGTSYYCILFTKFAAEETVKSGQELLQFTAEVKEVGWWCKPHHGKYPTSRDR